MADLPPAAVAVVAALIGGGAGGAVARLTAKAPTPAASASREPGAAPDTSDLEKRITTLEQNAAKSERSRRVERAAAAAAPSGDDPGGAAPAPGKPHIDDPVFDTAVRDIIDQVSEERREEREARQTDRRKRMAEAWTQEIAGELGLSDAQKQKVADIVREYFDSLRALRDSDAGPPASRAQWRERARAEREKAEKKLGQTLDAGQMEKYKGLDDDKKLGMGGGGRGRRPRD